MHGAEVGLTHQMQDSMLAPGCAGYSKYEKGLHGIVDAAAHDKGRSDQTLDALVTILRHLQGGIFCYVTCRRCGYRLAKE